MTFKKLFLNFNENYSLSQLFRNKRSRVILFFHSKKFFEYASKLLNFTFVINFFICYHTLRKKIKMILGGNLLNIELDAFKTLGIAVIFLLIGKKLRDKIDFFEKFAIPAPVIGGTLFAIIALVLNVSGLAEFGYDDSFGNFFMTMFFCSVGFNASIKILRQGGIMVVKFLIVAVLLCVVQNIVAIMLAPVVDVDPAIALMTGSTPMTGGHGTSGAIAPVLENRYGIDGAHTVAMTAATYGLIAGSLMGGPVATRLINKNNLIAKKKNESGNENVDLSLLEDNKELDENNFKTAFFILVIAVGVGTFITDAINSINANFQMPVYTGPMILGIILRNVCEGTKYEIPNKELQIIGDVSLQLFLAIALMTLKLWELASLAWPLIVLLFAQTVLMFLYANFVTFNVMGRNYDASVLASGHCGFGMGATPNGVANMESVTEKYIPSPLAFFVLPIVGGFFIDFINIFVINLFIPLVI